MCSAPAGWARIPRRVSSMPTAAASTSAICGSATGRCFRRVAASTGRCRGGDRQTVLVPALPDEVAQGERESRWSRARRRLLGPGADARPARAGETLGGCEERSLRAAQAHARKRSRPRYAPALAREHGAEQAPDLRQPARRSRAGRAPVGAHRVDRGAVRPFVRCGYGTRRAQHLAAQADPEGHHARRRRTRGHRSRRGCDHRVEPWRPSARRRALVDLRAAPNRGSRERQDRGVLRRRDSHGRRHRQGDGLRRRCVPDRSGISLWPCRARLRRRQTRWSYCATSCTIAWSCAA